MIYLLFNEGYLGGAELAASRVLVDDAEWVAAQLHTLMPNEPEPAGLLALIRLHRARSGARFTAGGDLVLLPDQDRTRWDRDAIGDADRLLVRAAGQGRPGPYQLQAAIVACHADAPSFEETDWEQIVILYDMLLALAPSPVTQLHRAIALRYAVTPEAALADVESLGEALDGYHLFHATYAELLRAVGEPYRARIADQRALELTANPVEKAVLVERLSWNLP